MTSVTPGERRPAGADSSATSIEKLCKLSVSVAGRSRIISIKNTDDVLETFTDLHESSRHKDQPFKGVTKFWRKLDQRVHEVLNFAKAEGAEGSKTVEAVKRAKAASDQLVRDILSDSGCV